ncbi:MAG: NUDIX domain-containing protein [Candidatus Riflebacteria bacterium]|nr:NUDIX domain-containing protein [Candidatus Riflebacteria bacterium]
MNEKILAVRRNEFPEHWLEREVALSMSWEHFLDRMTPARACFIDRAVAESDYRFKQIIPYILLADSEDRLATYSRNGSEKRLSGRLSLGIGGHLRQDDFTGGQFSWAELAGKALQRELLEELPGFDPVGNPEFIGIINEEHSDVGRVHVGLVFVFRGLDSAKIVSGEELGSLNWFAVSELNKETCEGFELWSWLALQLFSVTGHPF